MSQRSPGGMPRARWRTVAVALVLMGSAVAVPGVDLVAAARPNATNTGVPAGTVLTRYDGNLTITRAGATYTALDIHGFVRVKAPNVTIKNSIVRGGTATYDIGLVNNTTAGATNFVIMDSELVPEHPAVQIDGIKGGNYTALRLHIHGTTDGAKVFGDNATIQDSYIHDLPYYASDPDQGGGPAHNDGVEVLGGTHVRLLHNSIIGTSQANAALQVTQDQGVTADLLFSGNYVDGGVCSINLANKPRPSATGWTISDNRFGRSTRAVGCAILASRAVTFTRSGNVWDDTGAAVPIRLVN